MQNAEVGRRRPEVGSRTSGFGHLSSVLGLQAADGGEGLDGFGGDGVDGVEALGEQALEFGGVGNFGFVGRGAEDVHGFDDFFVEFEPFAIARGGLLKSAIDDGGDAVQGDGAAFEVIAVNGAEDVFGGDEGERVGLGGHGGKITSPKSKVQGPKSGGGVWELRSLRVEVRARTAFVKTTARRAESRAPESGRRPDATAILGSDTLGF